MTRALVTSSKYSPGNMTPEALDRLFVGREKLLSDTLRRLAACATGRGKRYFLLVGPRGVGKTHFVALLYHRLTHAPEYADARRRLKIAFLNEEEWGVASFLDLLVRILRALAAEYEDRALEANIEEIYGMYDRDSEGAVRLAQQLLTRYIGNDTLMLLCENLSDLFDGLGEEGQQRWRAFIQESPFWAILATTPSLFAGIQLQTSPFYGFFTIRNLEKLDLFTAEELLFRRALVEGKEELARFLRTPIGRARVKAVHHLAGGNHRVYVALSDFLSTESLDDLVQPFMRMVDDLTPYYQDRIRQLAPQQRKIVEHLCRMPRPLPVKAIASRCLISQQTAAKQLGELARQGFVLQTRVGRETLCELAEPLMRICIEVKDNRTEHLKLFVEFLRRWFSSRELRSRFASLKLAEPDRYRCDRLHLEVAIRECEQDPREPFVDALDDEARRCLEAKDYPGLAQVMIRLVEERDTPESLALCIVALREAGNLEDAVARGMSAVERFPAHHSLRAQVTATLVAMAETLASAGRLDEALAHVDQALVLEPSVTFVRCFRGGVLLGMQRYEEVVHNEDELLLRDPDHLHSLENKFVALARLGRLAEAEAVCRELLDRGSPKAEHWTNLGNILIDQGRYAEGLSALDRALEADANHERALCLRGQALTRLGRYEEVLVTEDRLLAVDPMHGHSYGEKAFALLMLGRFEQAEVEARKWLELEPSSIAAWENLIRVFYECARFDAALQAIEDAQSAGPLSESLLFLRVRTLTKLNRVQAANAALEQLADVVARQASDDASAWTELAYEQLSLSRYAEAEQSALKACELDPESPAHSLLACAALVGSQGFSAGLRKLEQILNDDSAGCYEHLLSPTVFNVLSIELSLRGPAAMARQLPLLRQLLESRQQNGALATALVDMLKESLDEDLSTDEWALAVPLLQSAVADIAECRIPIEMLSVAIRKRRSGDNRVLLELPLEQRTLLTQREDTGGSEREPWLS